MSHFHDPPINSRSTAAGMTSADHAQRAARIHLTSQIYTFPQLLGHFPRYFVIQNPTRQSTASLDTSGAPTRLRRLHSLRLTDDRRKWTATLASSHYTAFVVPPPSHSSTRRDRPSHGEQIQTVNLLSFKFIRTCIYSGMHDLRRQALESGKTVSKKAKSRQGSGAQSKSNSLDVSPDGSKPASRVVSRNVSDDEDNLSDETSFSTHSIDEMITGADDTEASKDGWRLHLHQQIEKLLDKKRSSVEGRELSLAVFGRILMLRFARDEIAPKLDEIASAVLKSATSGASDAESILALRGE